jgi:hypothetical protein
MGMSVVETIYLSVGGRYRKRRSKIETSQPTFLINGVDKQAHSLREEPLFIKATPIRLTAWEQLTGTEVSEPMPSPAPPSRSERLTVLCEDNSIWPVSGIPFTDGFARQIEMADTHQEALNLAESKQARERGGDSVLQTGFMIIMGVCVLLVLVIGVVVVQAKFGGEGEAEPEAHIRGVEWRT